MGLALSIVFLWVAGALLFVAFHGLSDIENAAGKPGDVVNEIRSAIQKQDNAYTTAKEG